ncbi:hypothetical protein ACFUGD_01385 [Streptomyces sp. NPDC057217]|uniref:hypothetical protein n=1 Tax=Streptomyces sp. NPDC057217 TaxID=3346054 RepID=UPI00363F639E
MEILVALIAGLAAVISAAVAKRETKQTRGAVEADGEATRSVTVEAVEALGSRFDGRIDDVRDDIDDLRESVARVREWQAGHDAEHLIIGQHPHPRGES